MNSLKNNLLFFMIIIFFFLGQENISAFPLTNGQKIIKKDVFCTGGKTGRSSSTYFMIVDIVGTGGGISGLAQSGTKVLANGYMGDPLSSKDVDYIKSEIFFPNNNIFVNKVDYIEGSVTSPIQLSKVEILLQRVSDNKCFNGNKWDNEMIWLTCKGTYNWRYNLPGNIKVFDYNIQYKVSARGFDVIGAGETKYPTNIFTYVYAVDFKRSVCNYPNPFYPDSSDILKSTTTIEYFLPEYKKVEIYIYAVNGELVKKWSGEEYNRIGLHRIKWDGKNENNIIVGNGLYMLVVKAGNKKTMEKIAVIR